jgi:hypothetical protein
MKAPTCIKDVQKLTGCMAALNRFISKLGERGLPFFKLLKHQEKFVWTPEANQALAQLRMATGRGGAGGTLPIPAPIPELESPPRPRVAYRGQNSPRPRPRRGPELRRGSVGNQCEIAAHVLHRI